MNKQIKMTLMALGIFLIGIAIFFWSENQFLVYSSMILIIWSIFEILGNLISSIIKNFSYSPIVAVIMNIIGFVVLIAINCYLKLNMSEIYNLTYTMVVIIGYLIIVIIITLFLFYQKKQNILVDNKNLNIHGISKLVDEQQSDKVEQMPIDERKKYLAEYSKKLARNPKYRSQLASKLSKEEIQQNNQDLHDSENKK